MLFSEILRNGRKGEVFDRNVKVTNAKEVTPANAQPATLAASFGFRFVQRQMRTGGETGRAMTGRPSIHLSRSSASPLAE